MGRKHRDKRKTVKAQLRHIHCGWHTNEYGELTKRLSNVCAVEDAKVYAALDKAILPSSLTTGAPYAHLEPKHR